MGITRHKYLLVSLALFLQLLEKLMHIVCNKSQLFACPKFQVHQDLVVATATRMNLLAHITKSACKQELHLRMYILNALFYYETAFGSLCIDVAQFGKQRIEFIRSEQPNAVKHRYVSHRAQYIVTSEEEVELTVATNSETLYCVIYIVSFVPEFHFSTG